MRRDTFRWIHLFALAVVGIGLAWGNALMSMGQLLLAAGAIAEGIVRRDLFRRFRSAFTSLPLLVFLSFFGLHVLGLVWTEDMIWGLDLCRILAPLVVLPVVLSLAAPLERQELRVVLLITAWSTVASTFACLALRPGGAALSDFRSLSVFISHIRLALLLCTSTVILLYHLPSRTWSRIAHLAGAFWSVLFIIRLESLQGLAILALIGLYFLWRNGRAWAPAWRWISRGAAVAIIGSCVLVMWSWVREHRYHEPLDMGALTVYSAGGEMYYHDRERPQYENGHAVWINVADRELERGWNARSGLPFDSVDGKGHPLRHTLVRYMASKGLTKDSLGLRALDDEDVRRVELGMTSILEGRRGAIRERVEEILFELDAYAATGDPSGYSIAMRLEFWKTGLAIAQQAWITGVGTGDTQLAFNAEYERRDSPLERRWRLRAHNEYLTLWISFGAWGFLLGLFSWIWPAWRTGAYRDPVFIAWGCVFAISCLTDDTPETQAGATFFAFFYALQVFGRKSPEHAGPVI